MFKLQNLRTVWCCLLISLLTPAHAFAATAASATQDKIIVSGASGQLGELTVKELLKRGVAAKNLILVSRTPDKLAEYAKLGASVRYGDFYKPESLPSAFAGGTKMLLISITPGDKPRPDMHKIAADAAVKAGVKLIVYTSVLGAETGTSFLAVDHRKSEEYIKASGAKWTMLRNGFYADQLIRQANEMLTSGRAAVQPNESKSAPVTREDCAAAAAGALTTPGHENKAYEITGPDLVDKRDVAKMVSEITGKRIEVVEQAASAADAGMGGPPPMTGEPIVTKAVQELAGRPATSMRAFLTANKDKLLAK